MSMCFMWEMGDAKRERETSVSGMEEEEEAGRKRGRLKKRE